MKKPRFTEKDIPSDLEERLTIRQRVSKMIANIPLEGTLNHQSKLALLNVARDLAVADGAENPNLVKRSGAGEDIQLRLKQVR